MLKNILAVSLNSINLMIAVFIVVRSLPINLYRYKLNRILLCFDKREIMNLLGINTLEFQIGILKKNRK